MPSIDTMHARKYLHFTDFSEGVMYFGTIRKVVKAAQRAGVRDAERVWELWFHDWPKPMRCSPGKSAAIAKLLGTKVTEEWEGRRIGFFRGVKPQDGDYVEGLFISDDPVQGDDGAVVTIRGNLCLSPKLAGTRIPESQIRGFMDKAKAHGADWSAFIGWLRGRCRSAHDLVIGRALDDIDGAVTPALQIYLDELAGVKDPGEKREKRAAFKATSAAGSGFAAAQDFDHIKPEDCPF